MTDEKHNGWTNYATWRVNLEVFDGIELSQTCTAEWCRDYMVLLLESAIDDGHGAVYENHQSLVLDYAMAFISEVNWFEISEHLNERLEQ
tara:strand:- start:74 stop:343 length:270 start_codon:yes stop_codon:yes gene_type:complete